MDHEFLYGFTAEEVEAHRVKVMGRVPIESLDQLPQAAQRVWAMKLMNDSVAKVDRVRKTATRLAIAGARSGRVTLSEQYAAACLTVARKLME